MGEILPNDTSACHLPAGFGVCSEQDGPVYRVGRIFRSTSSEAVEFYGDAVGPTLFIGVESEFGSF